MDLFDKAHQKRLEREAPLAARMRPRTLDEFVGQDHIVGKGRLLRRAIQADQLGSLIFCGPPGTGKTTLARIIAGTTKAHFIALNAVLAGVKDIRGAIDEAKDRARVYAERTILFVDEVHRFNKAQQDALLPWVENGTVVFVGATTENPYFEVNKALVSRSRIFQLTPLDSEHLLLVAHGALSDKDRGYGLRTVSWDDEALDHLVDVASGDARALLNALELAVETTAPQQDSQGKVHITLEVAEESIQHRAVLYDKEGDYHFDTISAFIKSVRGSDPDAALYWMAKMLHAGESPRFIFRRMLILASEDVGLADPAVLGVVVSCAQAFEQVGMPEGRFHLAHAALVLATAPKSNSTLGFFDALSSVDAEADSGVPNHLRDPNRDAKGFGHGEGYLYPHAYTDHWVTQQYLPSSHQGRVFYQPSDQGHEGHIRVEVARRRESQLAAMVSTQKDGGPLEMLTFSTRAKGEERWLQRTVSQVGEQLGALRDRVVQGARLTRHAVVLDLSAAGSLLLWEAIRQAPEGGVYGVVPTAGDAEDLHGQGQRLSPEQRPTLCVGASGLAGLADEGVLFDAVLGHNALLRQPEKTAFVALLSGLLHKGGIVSLAENIGKRSQRLYDLVDMGVFSPDLAQRIKDAEESIYLNPDDPMVNWEVDDLLGAFRDANLSTRVETQVFSRKVFVTRSLLERWFGVGREGRPSYAERLAGLLSPDEITEVAEGFRRQLGGQALEWRGEVLFLVATADDYIRQR